MSVRFGALLAAAGVVSATIVAAGEAPAPDVESALVASLVESPPNIVARYDWQAARSLPALRALLEARPPVEEILLVGSAVQAVRRLPIDESAVLDLWVESSRLDGAAADTVVARSRLTTAQLHAELERLGWVALETAHSVYRREVPPEDVERMREMCRDAEDPAAALERWKARLAAMQDHVVVFQGGWILLARSSRSIPWGRVLTILSAGEDEASDEAVPDPWSGLLEVGSPTVCAVAVDLPAAEDEGEPGVDPGDRRSLVKRQRALSKQVEWRALEGVGDVLLTATEIDGGLVLRAEARPPCASGVGRAADLLQMAALGLRMAVTYASADLSRELSWARVASRDEHAFAEAVLSNASLADAVESEITRQHELGEIEQRLRELEVAAQRGGE